MNSFIFTIPEFVAIENWVKSVSPAPEEEVQWSYSQPEKSRAKVEALKEKVRPNIGQRIQLPANLGELVLTDTNDTLHRPGSPLFTIWSPHLRGPFRTLSGGSRWEDHKMRTSLAERIALVTKQAFDICLRQCTGVDADEEADHRLVPAKPSIHKLEHFGAESPSDRWLVINESLDKAFLADTEGEAFDIWCGRTTPNEEDWSEIEDGNRFEF